MEHFPQGSCQIIDENFNLIINSSLPVVANDPVNSTIGLIIPEQKSNLFRCYVYQ